VDRAIEAMNAALAALRAVRGELDAPTKAALLAEGDVREAVVEWVEASGADVLLVGSRGLKRGALERAVLGSVSTYAVQQHAACAVLVVSAPVLKAMARAEQSEQELPAAATAKNAAAAVVPPPDAAGQHE
jgi:nucleotide-binding universal stress UspA family protein